MLSVTRTLSSTGRSTVTVAMRYQSSSRPREFKVMLDNETLYLDRHLAEALGWDPTKKNGVPLTLRGCAPMYFSVSRTGSDGDLLAQRTVESSHDNKVQKVLEYLKDR